MTCTLRWDNCDGPDTTGCAFKCSDPCPHPVNKRNIKARVGGGFDPLTGPVMYEYCMLCGTPIQPEEAT